MHIHEIYLYVDYNADFRDTQKNRSSIYAMWPFNVFVMTICFKMYNSKYDYKS